MEKNNVFLDFVVTILLVSFLSAIPSLLSGLNVNLMPLIAVAFLFCFFGVALSLFFSKARFVVWLGVAVGAVLVNWLLFYVFVWAINDGAF